jgi:hypothetical protein
VEHIDEPANPKSLPDKGAERVFVVDHGRGAGTVAKGTAATVRDVHEPGTAGVGHDGTPTVVVEVLEPPIGKRLVALPLALFHELTAPAGTPLPQESVAEGGQEPEKPPRKGRASGGR